MNYQLTSFKNINQQQKIIHGYLTNLFSEIITLASYDSVVSTEELNKCREIYHSICNDTTHLQTLLKEPNHKLACNHMFNHINMQLEELYYMLVQFKLSV